MEIVTDSNGGVINGELSDLFGSMLADQGVEFIERGASGDSVSKRLELLFEDSESGEPNSPLVGIAFALWRPRRGRGADSVAKPRLIGEEPSFNRTATAVAGPVFSDKGSEVRRVHHEG